MSQLKNVIRNFQIRLGHIMGENVKISGGQGQRIAKTIYHNKNI